MAAPVSPLAQTVQTQPRLSRLSLRGFLTLPRRLCAPPHAVGKVRSFGLTPIFDVTLEDVLDRKHLPPLSLKDFEEWLLFVEQCPENLYFVLWLREYAARYDQWMAKVRARERKAKRAARAGSSSPSYRVAWAAHTSPALALFFARARETFFAPASPYELMLPPELLSPFFLAAPSALSPHPDPAVFAPLKAHIETCLDVSLRRFVRAAYTNVGSYRAACGICMGTFITLAGSIPPLAVNFTKQQNRWERFAALPALWVGLTILIASLRGVCMMIYIFGDLRQLRRFELDRPPLPASSLDVMHLERNYIEHGHALHAMPTVSIAVPTRPVRALTAPPKISVRIPTRPSASSTPALTAGTSSFTATGTETSMSMSDASAGVSADTTLHTISISSLKSHGVTPSLVHWARDDRNQDNADTRSLAPSVPVVADILNMSDGGSEWDDSVDSTDEDGDDNEDDGSDEHGIYISPAMAPPDEAVEADPAVVSAALALMAAGASARARAEHANATAPRTHLARPSITGASMTAQTASFIPVFPYSSADPVGAGADCGPASAARCGSRRAGRTEEQDLEAGLSAAEGERTEESRPPLLPLGPFDFDALPALPRGAPTREAAPGGHSFGSGTEGSVILDEKEYEYQLDTPVNATTALCEKRSGGSAASNRLISLVFSLLSPFLSPGTSCPSAVSSHPWAKGPDAAPRSIFPWRNSCEKGRGWRTRCAAAQRTPAFGPVTRILEPVVARAQWEIVVRAGTLAALLSGAITGTLVALPVPV
ncbi:hypothetical protein M0805_004458 [Coniferiporia weirii]|nr:hypothetical protein M0805_004458 [Coniferiporia weirii]